MLPLAPAMAPPPHLLFSRVLLVAFFSLSATSFGGYGTVGGKTTTSYYDPTSMCQKSLPCGGNVDIHYPFFLADAAVAIDGYPAYSPYCGYAGMGIICDGGCAVMTLSRRNYTVLEIDYEKHAITLADRADVMDSDDCPRVTQNVTLPAATRLRLSAAANDSLSFFFDCVFTTGSGDHRPPPGALPINCSSFPPGAPGTMSFVAPQSDADGQQLERDRWARACKTVVVVPVFQDWRLDPELDLHLNRDGYGQVLKRGFQLSWEPSAGRCYVCEQTKGKCSYSRDDGEFLGCLCSDGILRNQDCGLGSSEKKAIAYIVSAVTGSIFLLFLLLLMCTLYRKKFHGAVSWKWEPKHIPTITEPFPKRYTYSEVKTMTKSFAQKLGKGGFGTVYMGSLPNGRDIAVKVLNSSNDDGQEFMNEIATITRTSHVNVVTLLGYCLQGTKRALIYEYMPNGSLERFSFGQESEGKNSLSWKKLFEIMVGIARGLEYLHRGCTDHIVHFDIKPHNILLDKDFCPKISDFGLAKLCMKKESGISIDGVRGTIGYIAPEIFSKQYGKISSKSDVYSYGMMILEMVGARNNINNSSETSSKYFPQWVYEQLEEYCDDAGEIGTAEYPDNELVRKLITVGLWCIQSQPENRPSMTRVIEMLESRPNDLQIPAQNLL